MFFLRKRYFFKDRDLGVVYESRKTSDDDRSLGSLDYHIGDFIDVFIDNNKNSERTGDRNSHRSSINIDRDRFGDRNSKPYSKRDSFDRTRDRSRSRDNNRRKSYRD